MAMAGIAVATLVATTLGTSTSAHAHGRRSSRGWAWGWGRKNRQCNEGGGGACFLRGTKILTAGGETEVERLQVGDLVHTASGQSRAIKRLLCWNATREPGQAWTDDVAPIKVFRSALGPNVPHRDLFLSPDHALYIDGVLMRAKGLVNALSIVRCTEHDAQCLTYFHLELEDHQVIVAEGAQVESLLGDGMTAFAPVWFGGPKSEFASRLRSSVSPWIDRRKKADKIRDSIDARGEAYFAA